MRAFEIAWRDLRTAIRMLRRGPAFAIAAIATLALGIGSNTAIFSLISATLLAPLPYPDSERLVQIWFVSRDGAGLIVSVPQIQIVSRCSDVFQEVAAYDFGGPGVNISGSGEPQQVKAIHVSAAYFGMLGARVELGRTFRDVEDRPGAGHFVVLSHELWMTRFGGDPGWIGKSISLGGEPHTLIGVIAADFRSEPAAELWLPLQADPKNVSQAGYLRAAARLRSGISLAQANARLQTAAAELHEKFPLIHPSAGFEARPLRETLVHDTRSGLLLLFATVGFVLLIACSNVANLVLARSVARRREMAIRAAIGASRARLAIQLLTESLVLAAAGAAAGIALGRLLIPVLLAWNPGAMPVGQVRLDGRVLGFTGALCIAATLLFGGIPALRASRAALATAPAPGTKLQSAFVVLEVAMAVVLAVGAGLMIRTFAALRSAATGIEPQRVITFDMSLSGTRLANTTGVTRMVERGSERLHRIPGVIAAATTWTLPVENAFSSSFIIEGRPLGNDPVHGGALMRPVSEEYASVFGIALVRGRFFSRRDTANSPPVAVISQAMAKKFWPAGGAIGARIAIDKYLGPDFAAPPREIVGIAGDVRDIAMNQDPQSMIYIPQSQSPDGMTGIDARVLPITWAIRASANTPLGDIRSALRDASGGLAAGRLRTMAEVVRDSTARSDFNTVLLSAFAACSLLLAAVGIYGLIAFSVQQSRRELGIRLAIGATPGQVRNMVLARGMRLTGAGVAAGFIASLVLVRFMRALIYGVRPVDPAVILISCAILILVALGACAAPARRASNLDPAKILKTE